MTNDGGPAFPVHELSSNLTPEYERRARGMSLRAWLAGTIAAGWRAAEVDSEERGHWIQTELAERAVADADAIIAALCKESP